MSQEKFIAQNAIEAFAVCDPDMPLSADSPYYINLDEVRAQTKVPYHLTRMILNHDYQLRIPQLRHKRQRFLKILFSGHRGSGKSTELPILKKVYENKQLPADLPYADLAYKLIILEYRNAEGWADIHPAAQKNRIFQEAISPKLTMD